MPWDFKIINTEYHRKTPDMVDDALNGHVPGGNGTYGMEYDYSNTEPAKVSAPGVTESFLRDRLHAEGYDEEEFEIRNLE